MLKNIHKFKIARIFLSATIFLGLYSIAVAANNVTVNQAAAQAYESQYSIFHPVVATKGMVVTEQELASKIGVEVLEQDGNAIDAAVAVAYALAVVLPNAGNLGGGGFMLVHSAENNEQYALDFREVAPSLARRDMFLDEDGNALAQKSLFSHQAVGVPGTVAGLSLALKNWGSMKLADLIRPAIELAENGFTVSSDLAKKLENNKKYMSKWPATTDIFWRAGEPLKRGDKLIQKDLAKSLKLISEQGPDAFYQGQIAELIATEMSVNSGLITKQDLESYEAKIRPVVQGDYRGYKVVTMPPPSSGGIHLIQMLNVLENWDLNQWGLGSADYIHHAAETMRFAYADRSEYLGDADFVQVPQRELTDKDYAQRIANKIMPYQANKSEDIKAGTLFQEGTNTTHYSIADKYGNVVAVTYTLNTNFGSGIVAAGTGILLNNEMDDFSAKPGSANVYGLIGSAANAIAPGKRPLSSMTPTIVLENDKPWLVTGTPGGSHIITTVLETLIGAIDFKLNPAQVAASPRFHHQWWPDEIRLEQGFSPDTIKILESYGHKVTIKPTMGKTQTILLQDGLLYGAADPRNPDSSAIGLD